MTRITLVVMSLPWEWILLGACVGLVSLLPGLAKRTSRTKYVRKGLARLIQAEGSR